MKFDHRYDHPTAWFFAFVLSLLLLWYVLA